MDQGWPKWPFSAQNGHFRQNGQKQCVFGFEIGHFVKIVKIGQNRQNWHLWRVAWKPVNSLGVEGVRGSPPPSCGWPGQGGGKPRTCACVVTRVVRVFGTVPPVGTPRGAPCTVCTTPCTELPLPARCRTCKSWHPLGLRPGPGWVLAGCPRPKGCQKGSQNGSQPGPQSGHFRPKWAHFRPKWAHFNQFSRVNMAHFNQFSRVFSRVFPRLGTT